jgi:N-hydroxyarylamine O-acetyltransferase
MNVQQYLDRINCALPEKWIPDLNTLTAIHRAHVLNVPFENLDVHMNVKYLLDEERFYDKVIRRRRYGTHTSKNPLPHLHQHTHVQ